MNHALIKRVTMLVIMAFTFTMIFPGYNFPQYRWGIKEELESVKKLCENKNFEKAQQLIEIFISKYGRYKRQYRDELSTIYFYKAKIHFTFDEKDLMENALRELYRTNPDFTLSKDENEEFISIAEELQKQIKAELPPSRVKIQVHIQPGSQETLGYNVDNPDINQAIPFENKDFELTLEPGFHDFYFFSKDSVKRETREVKEGEPLNFNIRFNVIAGPGVEPPKKKFPWLLAAAGAVVVGVLFYFFVIKKPKRTLTVTVGEGIDGSPVSGTYTYKKGAAVKCNYSLKQGYTGLLVKFDGTEVELGHEFKMYSNHTLEVTAAREYTLTVTKAAGIDGMPESGAHPYKDKDVVNYNYSLQAGYSSLGVILDDEKVPASGSIIMNRDHTLTSSATRQYILSVTMSDGVNGTPSTGTYTYTGGTVVNYDYSLQTGYKDFTVTLDGIKANPRGSIIMNANHTLAVSAQQYKLSVTRSAGVNGNPGTGNYYYLYGAKVNYNYSLQSKYKDLIVKLNGPRVASSGIITMNRDHELTASAVEIDDFPTVSITNPKNGDTVKDAIFIKVDATDDKGVVKAEFKIGGSIKRTFNESPPYLWKWDTTKNYTNGSYSITVTVYDTANQTASDEITVTVSN